MTPLNAGPLSMATAAVVMCLGGTPEEADAIVMLLHGHLPPAAPSACVEQVRDALAKVREDQT